MPQDREADSYRIYSMLMPGNEFDDAGWPHELWLIEDVTVTVVPPDHPCRTAVGSQNNDLNPHTSITPPDERKLEFQELLDDFDRHCHERVQLTREGFRLPVPFRLVTDKQVTQLGAMRFSGDKTAEKQSEFKGAPGVNSFNKVYFNGQHTLAMVYAAQWCGGLCGTGYWVVLELQNGQWKQLKWSTSFWVS